MEQLNFQLNQRNKRKLILENRLKILVEMQIDMEVEIIGESPKNISKKEIEIYNTLKEHHLNLDPNYTSLSEQINYVENQLINIDQLELIEQYPSSLKALSRIKTRIDGVPHRSSVFPFLEYSKIK